MSAQVQQIATPEMMALAGECESAKQATERFPWLECHITLELPVVHCTVRDLLEMRNGNVVETASKATSDVPLRVNGTLIGWTEFEVIGNTLAVRITELA